MQDAETPPLRTDPARWQGLIARLGVLLCVAACGLVLLPDRLERVRFNYDIGHADSPAYALQGRSLAQGKGLTIPYVTGFFHAYPPDIDRQDDHWPPLLAFALAPAFRAFGADAPVARQTCLWIATLLFPLSACLLAMAATQRAWPGLVVALPILHSTELLENGSAVMTDILLATMLCLFLASLFAARRRPPLLLAAGAFAALAWYGKGSQVLLFPFLSLAVLLQGGPRALLSRWHLGAWLVALLLLSPRLLYNARNFGNPLHNTQKPVSAFFGLSDGVWTDWDRGFYSVHWSRELPGPVNRFRLPYRHARSVRSNSEVALRMGLLGFDADRRDWARFGAIPKAWQEALNPERLRSPKRDSGVWAKEVPSAEAGFTPIGTWPDRGQILLRIIGLLWGAFALLVFPLWRGIDGLRHAWLRRREPVPRDETRALGENASLLTLFVLLQSCFVILFWLTMERLLFVLPVLSSTLGLCLVCTLLRPGWVPRRIRRHVQVAGLLCTLVLAFSVSWAFRQNAESIHQRQTQGLRAPPTAPRFPRWQVLGEQLAKRLPADAVLMSRNPWQLLWYGPDGMKAVGMPYTTPDVLFWLARYYGVTHLVLDNRRPGMDAFLKAHPQVLELVIRQPYRVYRIHYQRLPPGFLTSPHLAEPLWDARRNLTELPARKTGPREAGPPGGRS